MNSETCICKLNDIRADYCITQQEISDATGISIRTIISIEKGHRLPTLLSAMRIANYLSIPVEQLFEYKSDIVPVTALGEIRF